MYTQDFIKRMINQLVAALQMIMGMKAAGKYGQALQAIDQALEQLFGMKADLVKRLDDDAILASLTQKEVLDADRLLVAADLFKEEGDIHAAMAHKTESYSSYLRALNFYIEVSLSGGPQDLPAPDNKLEDLFWDMERYQLPHHTLYGMFSYYEKTGNFKRAERILARLAEDPTLVDEITEEYRNFYHRLLKKADTELESGSLPRSEVENSLARIQSRS